MINNILNKRGSGMQKIFILIFIFLVVGIPLGIYAAENETNNLSSEEQVNISQPQENITENAIVTFPNESSTIESSALEVNNTNQTPQENTTNILSETQNETLLTPEFEIREYLPEKTTRGETFEMKIEIKNVGDVEGKAVTLQIILPEGFESSKKEENLGNIVPGETVTIKKEISSSLSTSLGLNKIKILVDYKNG